MNSLQQTIDKIKTKISEQGPLEYFVHHNTIHHYEDLNFFDAVKKAAVDFNANPFMPEEFYIHKYNLRTIKRTELIRAIKGFIDKNQLDLPLEIILRLMLNQISEPVNEQHHNIEEIQAQYCINKPYFFSQRIKENFGIDIDFHVSPTIYRFLSAYFDYGSAYWFLENRQIGMWQSFCNLHKTTSVFDNQYRKDLYIAVQNLFVKNPIDAIQFILNNMGIHEGHVKEYLFEVCLKHKGWAGFIKSLEEHPAWIKCSDILPDFTDFVAVVLTCEYAAIFPFLKDLPTAPGYKKIPLHSATFLERFFVEAAKYKNMQEPFLHALPVLTDFNRQEIFHRSYEQSFYSMFLTAYASNKTYGPNRSYTYQVVCCIDDREESFRRYLEADSECETFGCAGHFGLNILYKGFFDKRYRSLCPVNVTPEFKVTEIPLEIKFLKYKLLLLWGELRWLATMGSKTLVLGCFQSVISATLNVIPFVLDIIDPRIIFHVKNRLSNYLKSSVRTQLFYKGEENMSGISFESRREIAASFLKMTGIVKGFSPFVFIVAHGSSSLNNPHKAAYDCGACGGERGSPNARLMASILNEQEIREQLKVHYNIIICPETRFIGAYHNTASCEVEFFDIEMSKDKENKQPGIFWECVEQIRKAVAFNAQERCRRFSNLPAGKDPDYYLKCVQARSADLRQPRPEYGHATNALCIIGPRACTRNLFLDRRAFLVSYEPELDTDALNLKKLLSAVIPVCVGINLEYYFSFVDNEIYGCGTKLPHNVNALIGVVNGHMSDLRPGLPWQMVEIHQPVRLLVTIVSQLGFIEGLLREENALALLIRNEWISIAVHDPYSHKIWVYKDKEFEEYLSIEFSPQYSQYDRKIFNTRKHLDFGKIAHG